MTKMGVLEFLIEIRSSVVVINDFEQGSCLVLYNTQIFRPADGLSTLRLFYISNSVFPSSSWPLRSLIEPEVKYHCRLKSLSKKFCAWHQANRSRMLLQSPFDTFAIYSSSEASALA